MDAVKNSIVIPVYKNEDSISKLLSALRKLADRLPADLEVVFVNDGSPDSSNEKLRKLLPEQNFESQLIQHSRNFGSFPAIRAGLAAATGQYIAVMAADLQEPPELAEEMLGILMSDECDVVVGNRVSRDDPVLSKIMSGAFWWLYRKLVIREIPPGGVDMFACNAQFRNELIQLNERYSSLIALIYWLGFRRKTIGYTRRKREEGKSAWTMSKKINYLMDSIFAFTDLPIKLLLILGIFGLLSSLCLSLVIVVAKISGAIDVPGYAATVITILFFSGFNSLSLGIIGSYVWRAYGNTQNRPNGIVRMAESFKKSIHSVNIENDK